MPLLNLGEEGEAEVSRGLHQLEKGQALFFPKKRQYKKGRQPFFVNINVSRAEYGGQDVLIATTTDITESVEKETQLIQAGKMTTLGVMAAGMAHEINQPLNVIQVSADYILKMLRKGNALDSADLKGVADDIIASVERASVVIKRVRDFSRQSEVARTKLNINDPIQDVFKILGHQLKAHEVEVALDLDPNLPPILADHNRWSRSSSIWSATRSTPWMKKPCQPETENKRKHLAIRSYRQDGHVAAEVTDTGIGMPEHVKNKLFEPFFTTKKTGKGTGLGTSISYGIVKDYDGHIEVESAPGKGTTFRLTFPAAA